MINQLENKIFFEKKQKKFSFIIEGEGMRRKRAGRTEELSALKCCNISV